MATRTCPECSTQYLATVRRCIDCDVLLVDDVEAADPRDAVREAATTGDGHGTIRLDLEGWGNQLKVALDGMLVRNEIPHVWEAGTLVVNELHGDHVTELLDAVEGSDTDAGGDVADVERVALEIEGLEPDDRDRLDGLLLRSGIEHAWHEDGALVVGLADEGTVLGFVESVFDDAEEPEPQDDGRTLAMLSELFVAADRLVRRVGDPRAEADYTEAARAVADRIAPYGFDQRDWAGLLTFADALREDSEAVVTRVAPHPDGGGDDAGSGDEGDATGGEEADRDVLRSEALADLRDRLRDLV